MKSKQFIKDKYYLKYLKYKEKYLQLKYTQQGGLRFNVIPNNGSVTEFTNTGEELTMSNQCMWISLRDYFINVLPGNEYPNSVLQIKILAGLDLLATRSEQFDWESTQYPFRQGIEIIANLFDLRIEAYLVDGNGNTHSELTNPDGSPMPMHLINEYGNNLVKIAFYGGHFQLITDNLNLDRSINQEPEKPKIFSKKTQAYEDISSLSSDIPVELYTQSIDLKQKYDINNKHIQENDATNNLLLEQIELIKKDIEPLVSTLGNLETLTDIEPSEKLRLIESIKKQYMSLYEENEKLVKKHIDITKNNEELYNHNEKLLEEITTFELLISEQEN
jgi:hypothetical protein